MTVSVASFAVACLTCGVPTKIRINGRAGHHKCLAPAAELLEPVSEERSLRLLHDLESTYQPTRRHKGKMVGPYWRPPMPEVTDRVQTSGWTWRREHHGPKAVLDRSGAWISSASSVTVAHGALEQTGEIAWAGAPGFYEVAWFPWTETLLPHPLGGAAAHAAEHGSVWVPHPRMQLLDRLNREDRWPGATALDSYTAAPGEDGKPATARLTKWTDHVQAIRKAMISRYGRDSAEYDRVKTNFAQAVALMGGTRHPGQSRTYKCKAHRPDWAWAIQDQSSCTLWSWADDLAEVARLAGRPDLAPRGMRATDELLIPVDAVDLFTTTDRTRGRKPLRLDPDGIELGTFKVKGIET